LALACAAAPASAGEYNLTIDEVTMTAGGETTTGIGINGSIPGPTLHWREGEDVTIHVTNNLSEDTSVHWHGILVPAQMDGVPGMSFDGIHPGETFTYSFTVRQHGTYWYHSHSGLQEQRGVFGSLIIDPAEPDPVQYDREYVVVLSDWLNDDPRNVIRNLKGSADYYNYHRRTVGDFFRDVFSARSAADRDAAINDRLAWGRMRMDPTDIADVSGYTYLINGQEAAQNWTALFQPGERVRLRFINASAMTYFDVSIPGLAMTVVNADGNNVVPVRANEFRIAVAETYDVIVEPQADTAYTIFAQARSRDGYARGTLAPRAGMEAPVPPLSPREVLTMADMGPAAMGGMQHMDGMDMGHGGMGGMNGMSGMGQDDGTMGPMDHGAMDHSAMGHGAMDQGAMPMTGPHAGHDMSAMSGMGATSGMSDGMPSMMTIPATVERLSYDDLEALEPYPGVRAPDRTIEIRLTGNMHRYFWSINGVPFDEAEPIQLHLGERVRLHFVNETMMDHPMHLHGMWMELENGHGDRNPRKHTISIPPGGIVDADVTVDAPGEWAFHCHLLYHMATGMMRRVVVAQAVES